MRRNSCRSRTQRTQPAALPAKQPAAELGPSIRRQGRKSDSIVRPCPVQPVCGKEQIVPGRTSPGTLRMQPAVQPGTRKSGPCKRILDVKIYIKVLTYQVLASQLLDPSPQQPAVESASATRSESSRAANCAASCASQPFQFCATKGKVRLKFIGKCDCHYYDETANVIIRWLVTTVRPLLRCRDEDSSGFFAIVSQRSHQKSTEPVLHSYFMCRQLGDQLKKKTPVHENNCIYF